MTRKPWQLGPLPRPAARPGRTVVKVGGMVRYSAPRTGRKPAPAAPQRASE